MSAPTIYRSDDPGAPVTTGDVKNGLYKALRACLVDGYGAKPAAGWSVVYDAWVSDGVCTFTNAAQSGVLGVSHNSYLNYGPIIFTASAMIDATTGVNVRSGFGDKLVADLTTSNSTEANECLVAHRNGFYQADYWCVIANEQFCAAFFSSNEVRLYGSDQALANHFEISHIFFGAADSLVGLGGVSTAQVGNFVQLGAGIEGRSESSWRLDGNLHGTAVVDGSGAAASGSVYVHLSPFATSAGAGLGGDYPEFIHNLRLVPVSLWVGIGTSSKGSAQQVADIPMLYGSPDMTYGKGFKVMAEFNAVSLTDVISIDGKNYLWAPTLYGNVMFISLDAADWQ